MSTKKEYPVCDRCGSPNVSADAAARWDHEKQDWTITNVFDKGHSCDDCGDECRIEWEEGDYPEALATALPHLSTAREVVKAWQQGYHQGVQDERTSEANIGIAGFGAKVEPARINPYLAQQPAPQSAPVGVVEALSELVEPDARCDRWRIHARFVHPATRPCRPRPAGRLQQ